MNSTIDQSGVALCRLSYQCDSFRQWIFNDSVKVCSMQGKGMEMVKHFITWLFLIALSGCEVISTLNQREFVDVKLIGVWAGEYLEKEGTLKEWIQTRHTDGTYTIDFSYRETDGNVKRFSESGKWWVKDRLFHEMAQMDMQRPDKYRYRLEGKCVYFELVEDSELMDQFDDYSFDECLIEDSQQAAVIW